MRRKKIKPINKIIMATLPLAITLFIAMSFYLAWSYLTANAWTILLVTGAIILVSVLLGYFNWKRFTRSLRRRFK